MQKASVYNKIRVILTQLKGKTFEDVYEFSREIAQKKLEVFELPSSEKDRKFCDPGTIRKSIRLAIRLDLIRNDQCRLTSDGEAASRNEGTFKHVLGAHILTHLNNAQFGIQKILKTIEDIKPPESPDADTIYRRGKPPDSGIDETEFRKLLFLLYLCDKIDREPRYIYFKKSRQA